MSSFLVTVCSSAEIDFRSFEFFGFTISDTQEMVLDKLSSKEVEPKVIYWEREKSTDIYPSNQILHEGKNMDYQFWYFDNRIIRMTFFDRSKKLLDRFLKDNTLGSPDLSTRTTSPPSTSYTIYTWIQNGIEFICTIDNQTGDLSYDIINMEVYEQYDKHIDEIQLYP